MFRGTSETVTLATQPEGRRVEYEGQGVRDGETITVKKKCTPPKVTVGHSGDQQLKSLSYTADPWVIGDAAWLLAGVIPGVIALGVDGATGAWRNLDDQQRICISADTPRTYYAETSPRNSEESPKTESVAMKEPQTRPSPAKTGTETHSISP